jgi:hypothetical protein
LRFRPEHDTRPRPVVEAERDRHPGGPAEWADNWLSNAFAWSSYFFIPSWCQTPEHFTSRLTQYLWTDCPCCLLWRGIAIGAAPPLLLWAVTLAYFFGAGVSGNP